MLQFYERTTTCFGSLGRLSPGRGGKRVFRTRLLNVLDTAIGKKGNSRLAVSARGAWTMAVPGGCGLKNYRNTRCEEPRDFEVERSPANVVSPTTIVASDDATRRRGFCAGCHQDATGGNEVLSLFGDGGLGDLLSNDVEEVVGVGLEAFWAS